jgi:methionine-rich copper-binding protein CopC
MLLLRAFGRSFIWSGLRGALVLWLVLLGGVHVAAAHAGVAESNPADGALLDEPPAQVTLSFTQELDAGKSRVLVFDARGERVDAGDGGVDLNDVDHQTMVVGLSPSLTEGTYTVMWTAVSAEDGDITDGVIEFTVGEVVASNVAAEEEANSGLSPQLLAAALIAFVLVVGGSVIYVSRA